MKVRITHDSIRLRLKQPEVEHFANSNELTEAVIFGGSEQLRFVLEAADVDTIRVRFELPTVRIIVPLAQAGAWAGSEQVGIEEKVNEGGGQELDVLIEKDFACLDASADENIGTYPNPKASCQE